MDDLTEDQRQQAMRWIGLNRARPFIEIVPIMALGVAVVTEAAIR